MSWELELRTAHQVRLVKKPPLNTTLLALSHKTKTSNHKAGTPIDPPLAPFKKAHFKTGRDGNLRFSPKKCILGIGGFLCRQ